MTPAALQKTPHDMLLADHAELDQTIARMLVRVHAGHAADVIAPWRTFEAQMREHMEAEERLLLPTFAREHPSEAASIRGEHEKIRALMDEIAFGLELHAVREDAIVALTDRIRTHAAREETLFYRWANRAVSPSLWDRLRQALRHAA
jgi:hemerythrin-like domain-containing protein